MLHDYFATMMFSNFHCVLCIVNPPKRYVIKINTAHIETTYISAEERLVDFELNQYVSDYIIRILYSVQLGRQ